MSISNEAIEAAARAMDDNFNPEKYPIMAAMFRDYARAALTAAAPFIQAAALREAAESFQGVMIGIGGRDPRTSGAAWLRARADQLEGKTK